MPKSLVTLMFAAFLQKKISQNIDEISTSMAKMIALALKSFERITLQGFFDEFISAVNESMRKLSLHAARRDLTEIASSFSIKMVNLRFRKGM